MINNKQINKTFFQKKTHQQRGHKRRPVAHPSNPEHTHLHLQRIGKPNFSLAQLFSFHISPGPGSRVLIPESMTHLSP
jgi:hypothetical protein